MPRHVDRSKSESRHKGPKPGSKYVSEKFKRGRKTARHPKAEVVHRPPPRPLDPALARSANDILREAGGDEALALILDDSDHPKAPILADKLRSGVKEIRDLPFGRKLLDSGLTRAAIAEIIHDRQKTRMFIRVNMHLDEVAEGIIRRAKDRFERCSSCQGWGRKLTPKQRAGQLRPDEDAPTCLPCDGIGWVLKSGEDEAIELFLELARLRKPGMSLDLSKKFLQQNQFNFGAGTGAGPGVGEPPGIDTIIRRADEQVLSPGPRRSLPATSSCLSDSSYIDVVSSPVPAAGSADMMPEEASVREAE